jgi:hypothetical protein
MYLKVTVSSAYVADDYDDDDDDACGGLSGSELLLR